MNQQKLLKVVESVSNLDNANFYNSLCVALSKAINAPFVFVATIDPKQKIATTISLSAHHQVVDNFCYSLEDTPCDNVYCGNISYYLDNVQHTFPKDKLLSDMGVEGYIGIPLFGPEQQVMGILVALYQSKVTNKEEILSFFLLFKGLLEKELEKDAYVEKLKFSDTLIEKSYESIFICDENQKIIECNPALLTLTGYEKNELIGQTPKIFSSLLHSKAFYENMKLTLAKNNKWSGEITNKKKSGEIYTQHLSINMIKNHLGKQCYVAFIWDVTEHKKAQEKIYFQANHDTLTGITNRFYFTEKLLEKITGYYFRKENRYQTSVIYFDIDNFNNINNAYGLTFGDKVLIKLTKRLKYFDKHYKLSRLDGDGFGVLIHYKNRDQLLSEIEKLNELLINPLNIEGTYIFCPISIGISTYSHTSNEYTQEKLLSDAKCLIRQSAQAMRHAKKLQNTNFLFFNEAMEQDAIRETHLKNDLEKAINNKLLTVHFQPIVNTKTQKIAKFECLVRWNNNDTWISPDEFIPIAEKYGLIIPLGQFVLEIACDIVNDLSKNNVNNIIFNVNRSIYEFSQLGEERNLWLETILKKGTPPHLIAFELTESVLAPENKNNLNCLKQLQSSNCKISLDDFGTGYSSLSYLRKFPIDFLKIDKSFINDIDNNNEDKVLVNSIISMSEALGIKVVAEGVETLNQLAILEKLKCDYIQGYYFSKPVPQSEILTLLEKFSK